MYISASRHEIHDISDRTYFQKPEEIIHGLREVVQILSSWKSDKLHLSFHLSFSVDFRRSSGQKSRKIISIGRPFTSWRLRTARNARDSDWKVLWVLLCRNAGPLANACVRLKPSHRKALGPSASSSNFLTSMRFKCCVSLLRNRCCLCPYGEEHCVTSRQRELLRNRPLGTLGQTYFFDENSTQKETMKPLFYSRERS